MPRRVHRSQNARSRNNTANSSINQSFPSLHQPLLPGVHLEFNSASGDTVEISALRAELSYFFLSSIQRWKLTGDVSFSILVQLFKIIIVTTQLLLLGSLSSTRVSYGERAQIAFKHLYLYEWDPQYETLPYPPSSGAYAFYSREEFYEAVGFVMRQYNLTEAVSLNGYTFPNKSRPFTACLRQFDEMCRSRPLSYPIKTSRVCRTFNLTEISPKAVDDWTHTETFLNAHGLNIDFSRLGSFSFNFSLLSPPIHHSDWDMSIECFQFNIAISFENLGQTGQVVVSLNSEPIEVDCLPVNDFPQEQSLTPRRIVHLVVDLLAFNVSFISLMMSVISIIRGVHMWKRTRECFSEHYGIRLPGLFFEFVSPWTFCVMKADLLIIGGSASKLVYNRHILDVYAGLAYMLGLGTLLVWLSALRYIELSSQTHLLLRTIKRCVPSLFRFLACALVLYFAFVFPAWVILGPFNMKFRSFISTLECLFSLINGDDMYVTFSIIDRSKGIGIFIFSRLFLYIFITLFIYAVLNIFVTIIFEAYEEVKEGFGPEREGMTILKRFLSQQQSHHDDLHSEPRTRASWHRLSSSCSISSAELASAAAATSVCMESSTEARSAPLSRPVQPETSFICCGDENEIEEHAQKANTEAGSRPVS
ncbi:unnamed protein product [Hymenolepis diminuta]|uniref:Uncharacterized protein n=2 Tax=Hymenolepis diminuta TaxID=6216 RepID=A0A564YH98_HYMDI|nr:unnamed protein product [Hymenolepis diminuta]